MISSVAGRLLTGIPDEPPAGTVGAISTGVAGVAGVVVVLVPAAALMLLRMRSLTAAAVWAAGVSSAIVVLLIGIHASISAPLHTYYDLSPIAARLAQVQAEGRKIAVMNKWEGELGYLTRLTGPVQVVEETAIASWLSKNPRGVLIYRSKKDEVPKIRGIRVLFTQPYRSPERVIVLMGR